MRANNFFKALSCFCFATSDWGFLITVQAYSLLGHISDKRESDGVLTGFCLPWYFSSR